MSARDLTYTHPRARPFPSDDNAALLLLLGAPTDSIERALLEFPSWTGTSLKKSPEVDESALALPSPTHPPEINHFEVDPVPPAHGCSRTWCFVLFDHLEERFYF